MCRAETTRTPSGAISSACWAAEPCHTPSMRVALPLTAAASGTVASISSWPGAQRVLEVGERLGLVAEGHAQDHDVRPPRTASALSWPENEPAGRRCTRARSAASPRAAGVARADRDRHARARRGARARPKPSAPEAPMIATGSVGLDGTAAEYRLQRDEARGKDRARHRRRLGHRRGDRARGWPPRARAWRSATSTRTARASSRASSTASRVRAGRRRHDLGARGASRPRSRAARPDRRARQQRRHRPLRLLREHRRGAVGLRARREPARHARRHPRGAAAACRSAAAARSSTSPARPAASARRGRSCYSAAKAGRDRLHRRRSPARRRATGCAATPSRPGRSRRRC